MTNVKSSVPLDATPKLKTHSRYIHHVCVCVCVYIYSSAPRRPGIPLPVLFLLSRVNAKLRGKLPPRDGAIFERFFPKWKMNFYFRRLLLHSCLNSARFPLPRNLMERASGKFLTVKIFGIFVSTLWGFHTLCVIRFLSLLISYADWIRFIHKMSRFRNCSSFKKLWNRICSASRWSDQICLGGCVFQTKSHIFLRINWCILIFSIVCVEKLLVEETF